MQYIGRNISVGEIHLLNPTLAARIDILVKVAGSHYADKAGRRHIHLTIDDMFDISGYREFDFIMSMPVQRRAAKDVVHRLNRVLNFVVARYHHVTPKAVYHIWRNMSRYSKFFDKYTIYKYFCR